MKRVLVGCLCVMLSVWFAGCSSVSADSVASHGDVAQSINVMFGRINSRALHMSYTCEVVDMNNKPVDMHPMNLSESLKRVNLDGELSEYFHEWREERVTPTHNLEGEELSNPGVRYTQVMDEKHRYILLDGQLSEFDTPLTYSPASEDLGIAYLRGEVVPVFEFIRSRIESFWRVKESTKFRAFYQCNSGLGEFEALVGVENIRAVRVSVEWGGDVRRDSTLKSVTIMFATPNLGYGSTMLIHTYTLSTAERLYRLTGV